MNTLPLTRLWPSFLLSGALIGLDQFSKQWAESHLALYQPQPLLPLLNLSLTYNPGAAFSFLSHADGWQRWFFLGLSLSISTLLVVWLTRLKADERWTRLALSLILAGAVGNMIDRIAYGYVIDFIDFFYPASGKCLPLFMHLETGCHWPTFNIADSAISVGVVLLLLSQLFDGKRHAQ
ncbi:MAG TPA: signal peptidase II [Gammaproteobacteria bacterium]|nr:signal peptidase II [Gammaproteobacteria bacterium]